MQTNGLLEVLDVLSVWLLDYYLIVFGYQTEVNNQYTNF